MALQDNGETGGGGARGDQPICSYFDEGFTSLSSETSAREQLNLLVSSTLVHNGVSGLDVHCILYVSFLCVCAKRRT